MAKTKTTTSINEKIPRPMNCFLAFRLEKQNEIVNRVPNANHRDISKILAKWWKEIPDSEKETYRERARLAKIEHAKKYPNYKYQPQKRNGRKTRKYVRRPTNKFTSRDEENNRMMELFYKNPQMLSQGTPASVPSTAVSFTTAMRVSPANSSHASSPAISDDHTSDSADDYDYSRISSPQSFSSCSNMGSPLPDAYAYGSNHYYNAIAASASGALDTGAIPTCSIGQPEDYAIMTASTAEYTNMLVGESYYENNLCDVSLMEQQHQQQQIKPQDYNSNMLLVQPAYPAILEESLATDYTLTYPVQGAADNSLLQQQEQFGVIDELSFMNALCESLDTCIDPRLLQNEQQQQYSLDWPHHQFSLSHQ
ncbi:hypothetical protein BDB00DRAFT_914433 [Zychaea mexicana]|uniref:uncharacterized protein n=1 Tax=Zychaea mexicana TaxID=64656 RepID=UPI0022FEAAE1|nr:uncharacterized protein BDB00DRAFT_914433 [Zychaea mexicana]KAI9491168.1 hypothetical protein BDB00DRAFT_914433 [Zychaea mexicana]